MLAPYIYFAIISVIAISVTAWDKLCAKRDMRRVPEKTLFIISSLGGSLFMYCTMQFIRHKTKHKRFMIGLPLMMILQIVIIVGLSILYHEYLTFLT